MRSDADLPTVRVRGEIDVATSPAFEQALVDAAEADRPLVIELGETTFMDSTGLSVLVKVASLVGSDTEPARLVIDSPCPAVYKTLTVSGIDRLVTITNPSTH